MAYNKGAKRFLKPVGNPADPDGLYVWIQRYLTRLGVPVYSRHSLRAAERAIRELIAWCEARSLNRPQEITKPILERYQRHLYHWRKPDGQPLSIRTQGGRLARIRGFFRWLARDTIPG